MLYKPEYNIDFIPYKYFLYSFMSNSGPLSLVTYETKNATFVTTTVAHTRSFLDQKLHGSVAMGHHRLGQYKEARWTDNCTVRSYTGWGASLVSWILKL
jgi:hypothetical protein